MIRLVTQFDDRRMRATVATRRAFRADRGRRGGAEPRPRLVAEGLAGYALGGLIDDRVKRLLRLDGTSAQIALGYACGVGV